MSSSKAQDAFALLLSKPDEALLNTGQVRALCGDIGETSLWRWERDPRMGFPPAVTINRRKYRTVGAMRAWLQRRIRQGSQEKEVVAS